MPQPDPTHFHQSSYLVVNKPVVVYLIGETGLKDNDFSVDWYQRVSPLIMLLIFGNIAAPHIEPLGRFWLMKRRTVQYQRHGLQGLDGGFWFFVNHFPQLAVIVRSNDSLNPFPCPAPKKTDKIFCQEELNRIHVGPTFHLKFRYAQIMVSMHLLRSASWRPYVLRDLKRKCHPTGTRKQTPPPFLVLFSSG